MDQHGSFDESLVRLEASKGHPLDGYLIGPNLIGLAEGTFYEYLDSYRRSHQVTRADFEEQLRDNHDLAEFERLALQMEQSIYVRFWEADLIVKELWQLSSLALGEPYNWHLTIPVHSRDDGPTKQEIIRLKVRDRLKSLCPRFYDIVKRNYISQVRNAIAHSQFYILGRHMQFLNHSKDPNAHAPLAGMNFDEWYSIFHDVLLLHNNLIRAFTTYRADYKQQALQNGNNLEVRIIKPNGDVEFGCVGARHDRDEFLWCGSLDADDLAQVP